MGKIATVTIEVVGGVLLKEALDITGNVLEGIGLKSVGKEVGRWADDLDQVLKVASGKYHEDAEKVAAKQAQVEEQAAIYNSGLDQLVERMEGLIAFDQIFQMAMSNRVDEYVAKYSPQLQALMGEYKDLVAKLKSDYDFVLGLTEGPFLQKIVGSLLMIIGGLMHDIGDIISGKANGDTWKRIVTAIILVILVVITVFFPALIGLTAGAISTIVIAMLTVLSAFMTLDGMYANGAGTSAIMGVLDTVFNDVLNLDDRVGSDFDKFDKDNEDYAEMVMYVKLSIAMAQVYVAWSAMAESAAENAAVANSTKLANAGSTSGEAALIGVSGTYGSGIAPEVLSTATVNQASVQATEYLGGAVTIGTSAADSTVLGVSMKTYSQIYDAYSKASSVGDVVEANKRYEELKDKLESDKAKVDDAIFKKISKNHMKNYKDSAYFLQDQQEYIDRYLWSMTANNMYVDPYGTTPVANSRFTPDKGTRIMSFGFEDAFDESKQAGSKGYFNSILYG